MSSNNGVDLNPPDYVYSERMLMLFREMGLARPDGGRLLACVISIMRWLTFLLVPFQGYLPQLKRSISLVRFLEHPPQDQVLIGHFEDLRDMVRSIRQVRAGRKSQ